MKGQAGMTLIELMIVIAIVGILSAIATVNFIGYRNKAYCSSAERDSHTVIAGLAAYFGVPSNQTATKANLIAGKYIPKALTNNNVWEIDTSDVHNIRIMVSDYSERCPEDYRIGMSFENHPVGYWSGYTYIKPLGREL
ncbi:MAG: prepilin-type N-terminal cleavage/methylation domain-containing protein [Desulfamplus sp.]|nr:prepilin-type N-terminal cleavage/methylation domain-containing protein [Desulfamplus sp.]